MQRRFKDTGLRNFVPCPPPHVSIAVTISIPRPKRLTQLLTPRSWLSLRGAGREPSAGDSEEALSCRVCMVEVGMPAGMELCVCVYIYMYACTYVHMYACSLYVCMYVCRIPTCPRSLDRVRVGSGSRLSLACFLRFFIPELYVHNLTD